MDAEDGQGCGIDWCTPPSKPLPADSLVFECHDFLAEQNLQLANEHFVPDQNFYDGDTPTRLCSTRKEILPHRPLCRAAINVDGLWVLATRACPEGTAARAASIVRSYVPVELRQLFAKWRAPKGR